MIFNCLFLKPAISETRTLILNGRDLVFCRWKSVQWVLVEQQKSGSAGNELTTKQQKGLANLEKQIALVHGQGSQKNIGDAIYSTRIINLFLQESKTNMIALELLTLTPNCVGGLKWWSIGIDLFLKRMQSNNREYEKVVRRFTQRFLFLI